MIKRNKVTGIYCLILTTVMIFALTGCANPFSKVTAEGLISHAFPEDVRSESLGVSLELKGDVDMSQFGGDAGTAGTLSIKADDMTIKETEDIAYMEGTVSLDMMGQNMSQSLYEWEDYDEGKSYQSEDNENWTVTDLDDSENTLIGKNAGIDKDVFSDISLDKDSLKKDSDYYIVNAKISSKKLTDMAEETGLTNSFSSLSIDNSNADDMEVGVKLSFDKEDKYLRKAAIDIDKDILEKMNDADSTSGIKVSKITFSIEDIEYNKDNDLSVPQDVKDKALDNGDEDTVTDDMMVNTETKEVAEDSDNASQSISDGTSSDTNIFLLVFS